MKDKKTAIFLSMTLLLLLLVGNSCEEEWLYWQPETSPVAQPAQQDKADAREEADSFFNSLCAMPNVKCE